MSTSEDLERRRIDIGDAAMRVITTQGLAGLSVRNVAAEAGVAASSLRYLFPTQAELREHAFNHASDRVGRRVATIADDGNWARTALLELLPLDEVRREEMEVYLVLSGVAMTDEALAPAEQRMRASLWAVCDRALRGLAGRAPEDVEVDTLLAVVDGLALHLLRSTEEDAGDRAVAALDFYLARL